MMGTITVKYVSRGWRHGQSLFKNHFMLIIGICNSYDNFIRISMEMGMCELNYYDLSNLGRQIFEILILASPVLSLIVFNVVNFLYHVYGVVKYLKVDRQLFLNLNIIIIAATSYIDSRYRKYQRPRCGA